MKTRLGITGDPRHTQGNRHCLLSNVRTDAHFGKWLIRVSEIPDFLIDETCDAMRDFGITIAEADEAKQFLKYRRTHLAQIIGSHRGDFDGILQWSLI